jgi:hypothetical protein
MQPHPGFGKSGAARASCLHTPPCPARPRNVEGRRDLLPRQSIPSSDGHFKHNPIAALNPTPSHKKASRLSALILPIRIPSSPDLDSNSTQSRHRQILLLQSNESSSSVGRSTTRVSEPPHLFTRVSQGRLVYFYCIFPYPRESPATHPSPQVRYPIPSYTWPETLHQCFSHLAAPSSIHAFCVSRHSPPSTFPWSVPQSQSYLAPTFPSALYFLASGFGDKLEEHTKQKKEARHGQEIFGLSGR